MVPFWAIVAVSSETFKNIKYDYFLKMSRAQNIFLLLLGSITKKKRLFKTFMCFLFSLLREQGDINA